MSCIFCSIVSRTAPASVIYEDDQVMAFMGIRPIHPGECMIIPKEHIDHFTDLSDSLSAHVVTVAQHIGRKMFKVFSPLRVGMLVHGFGVAHAHLLIIPQHDKDDLTSAKFARIENGALVFDLKEIPFANRAELDRHAKQLSIAPLK